MKHHANRIGELRRARGMTQEDLADKVGSHRVTIAKLEAGKIDLTLDWMVRLAAIFDVAPQDLISNQTGESVPIVGKVQAGSWADHPCFDDGDSGEFITIPLLKGYVGTPKQATRVVGNSMNELYPDGSIVVWIPFRRAAEELRIGRRYIIERVRHGSYEATLKEFRIDSQGREWLVPRTTDPAEQAPLQAIADDGATIRVVGRVIWASRAEEQDGM